MSDSISILVLLNITFTTEYIFVLFPIFKLLSMNTHVHISCATWGKNSLELAKGTLTGWYAWLFSKDIKPIYTWIVSIKEFSLFKILIKIWFCWALAFIVAGEKWQWRHTVLLISCCWWRGSTPHDLVSPAFFLSQKKFFYTFPARYLSFAYLISFLYRSHSSLRLNYLGYKYLPPLCGLTFHFLDRSLEL